MNSKHAIPILEFDGNPQAVIIPITRAEFALAQEVCLCFFR